MHFSLKWVFILACLSCFYLNLSAQEENIEVLEEASYDDEGNIVCITPDVPNVLGGARYQGMTTIEVYDTISGVIDTITESRFFTLSLDEGFYISLNIFFGSKDSLGGEGFVLVFTKDSLDLTVSGLGDTLGYQGIDNSLGIVFDTHFQPEAPFNDIMWEDKLFLVADSILSEPLYGPVTIRHPIEGNTDTNVEDSTWVLLDLKWDPQEQLLEVAIDNYIRMSYNIDLKDFFGGQSVIYPGLVAATGENTFNAQKIRLNGDGWHGVFDPRPIDPCENVTNLYNWIVVNHLDYGAWKWDRDLGVFTQDINGRPTMLASPLSFIDVEMEGKITVLPNAGDDDYIGICWGLQQPFGQNYDNYNGWLLDWRKQEQSGCNNAILSPEGRSLVYMNGFIDGSCDEPDSHYFFHHDSSSVFQVIDTEWGTGEGWQEGIEYTFKVRYMTNAFDVWILDGNDTVYHNHQEGSFEPGRFAFYNHSQKDVEYSDFKYKWLPEFNTDHDTICAGDSIRFSYTVPNSLLPTIVDSMYWVIDHTDTINAVVNNEIPDMNYRFLEAGNHTVSLWIVDPSSCKSPFTKDIFVNPLPLVDLGQDTILCPNQVLYLAPPFIGAEVTWQDSIHYPTLIASVAGSYHVNVDYGGCIGVDTINIAYADTIQYNTDIRNSCFEQNNGIIDIALYSGNGVRAHLNEISAWNHTDLSPGGYHLQLIDDLGCIEEEDFIIEEACEPLYSIEVDSVSCYDYNDGRISLQANNCPIIFSIDGLDSLNHIILNERYAGDYPLVYTDSLGCEWESIITIESPPSFEVITAKDTTIIFGQCIELWVKPSYGEAIYVDWSPDIGLDFTDTLVVLANPIDNQQYSIILKNEKGCEAEGFINLKIDKSKALYIPNVFSPNGDGVNDILFPQAGDVAKGVKIINYFSIFNRKGGMIFLKENFFPDDPSMGWDGYFKGKQQAQGVYVYIIEWVRIDEEVDKEKGDIIILR